jgi:hypothetical protein
VYAYAMTRIDEALDFSGLTDRRDQPSRAALVARKLLFTVEAFLYLAFIADCFVLLASVGRSASYYPDGGVSLIPILLLIGLVHNLRAR